MGRWSYALKALLVLLASQSSDTFAPQWWQWRRAHTKGSIGRTYTDSLSKEEQDAAHRYDGMYDYSTPALAQNDAFGRPIDRNKESEGDKIYEMYAEAWKTANSELSSDAPRKEDPRESIESQNAAWSKNSMGAQSTSGSQYSYTYDPSQNAAKDVTTITSSETYNSAAYAGNTDSGTAAASTTGAIGGRGEDVSRMTESAWNAASGSLSTDYQKEAQKWPDTPSGTYGSTPGATQGSESGTIWNAYNSAGGWRSTENKADDRMNTDIDLGKFSGGMNSTDPLSSSYSSTTPTPPSRESDDSKYNTPTWTQEAGAGIPGSAQGLSGTDPLSSSPQSAGGTSTEPSNSMYSMPSWSAQSTGIGNNEGPQDISGRSTDERTHTHHMTEGGILGGDPLSSSAPPAPSTMQSSNSMYDTPTEGQNGGAWNAETPQDNSYPGIGDGTQTHVQPMAEGGMGSTPPSTAHAPMQPDNSMYIKPSSLGTPDQLKMHTHPMTGMVRGDPRSSVPQNATFSPNQPGGRWYDTLIEDQHGESGNTEPPQPSLDSGVNDQMMGGGTVENDAYKPVSPTYNAPAGDPSAGTYNTGDTFRGRMQDTPSANSYANTLLNPNIQYHYDGGSGTYDPPARTRHPERRALEKPRRSKEAQAHDGSDRFQESRGTSESPRRNREPEPQAYRGDESQETKEPPRRSTVPRGVTVEELEAKLMEQENSSGESTSSDSLKESKKPGGEMHKVPVWARTPDVTGESDEEPISTRRHEVDRKNLVEYRASRGPDTKPVWARTPDVTGESGNEPNADTGGDEGDRKDLVEYRSSRGPAAASQNPDSGNSSKGDSLSESQRFPGIRVMEDDGIGRMPSWVRDGGGEEGDKPPEGAVAQGDDTAGDSMEGGPSQKMPSWARRTETDNAGADNPNMPQWAKETLRGKNSGQASEASMRESGDGTYTKPSWAQSSGPPIDGEGDSQGLDHSQTEEGPVPDAGSSFGELSAAPYQSSGKGDMQNMPQWAKETLRGKNSGQSGEGAMREAGDGTYTKPAWAQSSNAGSVGDGGTAGPEEATSGGSQNSEIIDSSFGELSAAPYQSSGKGDMQNMPQWAKETLRGKNSGQAGEGSMREAGDGTYSKPAWAQSPDAGNAVNGDSGGAQKKAEGVALQHASSQSGNVGAKSGAKKRPPWAKEPGSEKASWAASNGKPNMPAWAQKSIMDYKPEQRYSGGGYSIPDWARSSGGVQVDMSDLEASGGQSAGGSYGTINGDTTQDMSPQGRNNDVAGAERVKKGDNMPSWARKSENGKTGGSQNDAGAQYGGGEMQNMSAWARSSGESITPGSSSPRKTEKKAVSPRNAGEVNGSGDNTQNVPAWVQNGGGGGAGKSGGESKPSWVRNPVVEDTRSQKEIRSKGDYGKLQDATQARKEAEKRKKESKVHMMPAWFSKVQNREEEEDEVSAALEFFMKKMANNEEFKKMSQQERISLAAAAVMEEKERKKANPKQAKKVTEPKETKTVTKALNKISETLHLFGGKDKKTSSIPKKPKKIEPKQDYDIDVLAGVPETPSVASEPEKTAPKPSDPKEKIAALQTKKSKTAVRGTMKDKKPNKSLVEHAKEPEPMRKLAKIIAEKDSKKAVRSKKPPVSKVEPRKPVKKQRKDVELTLSSSTRTTEEEKRGKRKETRKRVKTTSEPRAVKKVPKTPPKSPSSKKKPTTMGPTSQEARELASLMKSISAVLGVSNGRPTRPEKSNVNGETEGVNKDESQRAVPNNVENARKEVPEFVEIDMHSNDIDCARFAEEWSSIKYEVAVDPEMFDELAEEGTSASDGNDSGSLGWRFSRNWGSFFS